MSKARSRELLKRNAVRNLPFVFDLNVLSLNCQKVVTETYRIQRDTGSSVSYT